MNIPQDMIDSIEKCEDVGQLINFIAHCQEVISTQRQNIIHADALHNQAIDGIKLAKKRLKVVIAQEPDYELGVRPEGLVSDGEETTPDAPEGTPDGDAGSVPGGAGDPLGR